MAKADSSARAKSLFGNYDILETVGQGGMGVVYKAQDINLDRVVALKVLKDDLRSHASIVERFRREGEAFASLNHPNIVHIYSVGSVGEIPYIAMEYIHGEPLSRRMKREKRMDWKKALKYGQQIAEALASAHDTHIIHRDIKPANILISSEGKAYVTDFGIAKILTAETNLTLDGARLGTPQYMSPERCENLEVTTASDIYSLGVVLFQLITGSLPYEGDTPMTLVRRITAEPPKRLRDLAPDVPKDVERLVAFMIEKAPKNRPKSAHDVAALIARVREGKPLEVDDSGMRRALEEFRDTMVTPTPTSSSHFDAIMGEESMLARIKRGWKRTPASLRTALAGALVVAAAAYAGVVLAEWLNRDYAIQLVDGMQEGAARWQEPADVANYFEEAPGVVLARINLDDFAVTDGRWFSQDHMVMTLRGRPNTPRAGEWAMTVLHPPGRSAALTSAPGPSAVQLLGIRRGTEVNPEAGGFYVAGAGWPGELLFARWDGAGGSLERMFGPQDPLRNRAENLQFGPVSVNPATGSLVMAISGMGPPDTWTLIERRFTEDTGGFEYVDLTRPGLPVISVNHAPADHAIAYVQQAGATERELWMVSRGERTEERLVRGGTFTLATGTFDPTGQSIAFVEWPNAPAIQSPGAVKLIDADTGQEVADLGPANSAAWTASPDALIVSAPDHRGALQLWSVDVEPPHGRIQLTHLESGTTDYCAVSPDGAWAVSLLPETGEGARPRAVFVDLSLVDAEPKEVAREE